MSFHTKKRIEFSETDLAGIVHFSQYFRYMEIAEHELFRSLGMSVVMDFEGTTITWPRVSCSFDYKAPLHFEKIIDICIDIPKIGSKSIQYTATITCDDQLIAIGKSVIVCCSYSKQKEMKSICIPESIKERFSKICNQ